MRGLVCKVRGSKAAVCAEEEEVVVVADTQTAKAGVFEKGAGLGVGVGRGRGGGWNLTCGKVGGGSRRPKLE